MYNTIPIESGLFSTKKYIVTTDFSIVQQFYLFFNINFVFLIIPNIYSILIKFQNSTVNIFDYFLYSTNKKIPRYCSVS